MTDNGRAYPLHRCAICGSAEHISYIDIEDFEYKIVCEDCRNANDRKLDKLIDKAEYAQKAMEQAQANSYQACEKLRDYIEKGQKQCKDKEKHQKS